MIDLLLQIGLMVFGVGSMLLIGMGYRVGFVVGLAHQPLWLIFAIRSGAWGVAICVVGYGTSYALGVWRHYFRSGRSWR